MSDTLLPISILSLYVSGLALAIATAIGVPVGARLALRPVPGQRFIVLLIYTGMGLPPVVVGLFVYLLLSRSGPLGGLGWLFTPAAMVAAQVVIALPLVTGLTLAAVGRVDPALRAQVHALGATSAQVMWAVLREARSGVGVAIAAAFGGIISEVGAVMLVGGNIEGSTRVLTTSIVLETRKGDFDLALALGAVLVGLTFFSNFLLLGLQGRGNR
ncbi:MAG: ABC transporter permease subunit [Candidatus Latescibacteria bacterium]|nr:ABC transporter permease subunit [Candidatus Latescibacterota bacterium]